MKSIRRTLVTAALAAVTLAVSATPAAAITGGVPDGENHPNVGLIAFYDGTARYRCSATLITKRVLLTAAHCTDGTRGRTAVTFTSEIAKQAPSGLPAAADPAAGYTTAELAGTGYLAGTAKTHPLYSHFTDLANWYDVGVVVLDADAPVAPATLTPANHLDRYAQPALTKTIFDLVGYGTEVRKPEAGPQKPQPMSFPLLRRYTTSPGQKLTPQILQLNGVPNDTRGGGGTCFGDSGGPVFRDGYVVAVTSYGYTDNCRYLGGYQRVDIAGVQSWLAGVTG